MTTTSSSSSPLSTLSDIVQRHRCNSHACALYANGSFLPYHGAYKAWQHHVDWWQRNLWNIHNNHPNNDNHHDDVVVAFLSNHSTDFILSLLAVTHVAHDCQITLLPTRWTSSEMATVLQTTTTTANSSTTILVYGNPQLLQTAQQAQTLLRHDTVLLKLPEFTIHFHVELQQQPQKQQPQQPQPVLLHQDEIDAWMQHLVTNDTPRREALILFTSGTSSGIAKGVRLSHEALLIQALAKLNPPCRYSSNTRMFLGPPLHHVGGLNNLLALWLAGGTWILPSSNTLNAMPDTSRHANTLVMVPAMLSHWYTRTTTTTTTTAFTQVQLLVLGGQAASSALIQQCRPLLPNAKWVQTYACTEAASSLTFYECTTTTTTTATNNNNKNDNVDCVGTPPAHVQLQLKHARPPPHDMLVNQPYQTGIIGTRGPHVMNGYWVRGARAPKDDYSQKWFWTTDLGYFDAQGRLHFQGRLHHVVRTGGETVHCQAVERALQEIHGECAVFGLPDDYYGERVCAAFTNPTITLELVKETCKKAGLAGYKHPKQVFVVHSLPRNSSGKVLYYKLVEQLGTPATSKL